MTTTQEVSVPNERELWDVRQGISNTLFVNFGRVIDQDVLMRGGTVLVSPFRAGVGVEDSEELDKVALMVVRGIVDVFEKGYADEEQGDYQKFDLIFSNDGEVDFVIDGYILTAERSGKLYRKIGIDHKELEVEGAIKDWKTGKTIAIFTDTIKTKNDEEDLKAMGREIGQNIAQFLLNEVKE